MTTSHTDIVKALQEYERPEKVHIYQRFFKTGKGQYGENDVFIGVSVPNQRLVAKAFYKDISLTELSNLLKSHIHECRLTAIFILVLQYQAAKKDTIVQDEIVNFYINHRSYINNWDIVDSSTHKILGPYVERTGNWDKLYELASESLLWSKRIAVVALMHFFKKGKVEQGLQLLKVNLEHPHDLMHKANGWMLRELGNKHETIMIDFIRDHYDILPRTTLRYAIEKLNPTYRNSILKGEAF